MFSQPVWFSRDGFGRLLSIRPHSPMFIMWVQGQSARSLMSSKTEAFPIFLHVILRLQNTCSCRGDIYRCSNIWPEKRDMSS